MTLEQLVTGTKIAKMAGQDRQHFLNHDIRHLQKLLSYIAGLTKLGFHLIGEALVKPQNLRLKPVKHFA